MFPFVSRPRNFMNKVQRACIMFMKETKPFMIKLLEGRMSDNVSICFDGPVTLWIKNFMNKVQRACIMFVKETKPFMI